MPSAYFLMRAEIHATVLECFERYPRFTGSGSESLSAFHRVAAERKKEGRSLD